METCQDGSLGLSLLEPAVLFVVLRDLGLCRERLASLELGARLWHMASFSSQVRASSWAGLLHYGVLQIGL